ncbi:MAG: cellulose biosynthesis cyclic di-GMP-binding regulatory protein BcsB [Kastovskya adunca ATA6-11-RM4]|nr:cellulose biosynthesis cyclic di-GMP-binding regulatory protein BcsB [Kastovskya adunca ATA6-11-RM4]
MQRFLRYLFRHLPSSGKRQRRHQSKTAAGIFQRRLLVLLLAIACTCTVIGLAPALVQAQSENEIKQLEDQQIKEFSLPSPPPKAPVYKPRPAAPSAPAKSASPPRRRQPAARPAARPAAPPPAAAPPRQQRRQSSPPVASPAPRPAPQPVRPARATPPEEPNRVVEDDTTPTSQYVLEFNRSPVVGERFRLEGFYSQARLGFTRPRNWDVQSAKALIRYQHSPALLASRSNLTVMMNGASIGSIPLNRKQSQIGSALFNIPPERIRDFNNISLIAQQHNAQDCKDENASDPTLWTEILPDSKVVFEYQPQPVALNFSRYPYPFFDDLSLDPNQIAFLEPQKISDSWLTASARYSAALGRLADYRPVNTRLVTDFDEVDGNERLAIIGTPEEQPALQSLELPFEISGGRVLDGNLAPLPPDVGVLMVTTTEDSGSPVLVATGNGPEGVAKAVQFLIQPQDRKLGTSQGILVTQVSDVPTPAPQQWPGYLPQEKSFKLSDLKTSNDAQPFKDITVRGSNAPPVDIDFRALPNNDFKRGSSMNLRYSYGPQVNPRTSAVEVLLDGVFIGGARLSEEAGATRKSLKVNLPENLIQPNSKLQVAFRLNPREPADACGRATDGQLTGTVHADTSFNLNRENSVQLPDLKLLRFGFPFAAPQDLSQTAIVVPQNPSPTDLLTLLEFSERLGRLSKSESVKLQVYTTDSLPEQVRSQANLVGIGVREQFPFPEVFQAGALKLKNVFGRQWQQGNIQTLSDEEGIIQEIISPWNSDRVLLALSGQTETGLEQVQQLLDKDPWFFQLQDDTVLVSSNLENTSAYDEDAYNLEFLQKSQPRRIEDTNLLSKVTRWLQEHWFLLPTGVVLFALVLYGISQLYLKRIAIKDKP